MAARLGLPVEAALRAVDVPAPTAARALAFGVLAVAGGAIVLSVWVGRLERTRGGVLLLALVPVVSPLGWEHAYVLALPLLLWVLIEVRDRARAVPLVTVAAVALMLPRPPARLLAALVDEAPAAVVHGLNARMLVATLALGALLAVWGNGRNRDARDERALAGGVETAHASPTACPRRPSPKPSPPTCSASPSPSSTPTPSARPAAPGS